MTDNTKDITPRTAKESRTIADEENKKDFDFESLLSGINKEAGKGNYCFKTYGISYSSGTIDKLKELGYSVEVDEYNDTTIKW